MREFMRKITVSPKVVALTLILGLGYSVGLLAEESLPTTCSQSLSCTELTTIYNDMNCYDKNTQACNLCFEITNMKCMNSDALVKKQAADKQES
jgi:hypothetical protein